MFLPYSLKVSCLKWSKKIQFFTIWSCWGIWGHSEFMDVWSVLHSLVLQIKQRTSPHLSGQSLFTHIKHTTPHHCHVRLTNRNAETDCSTHPLTQTVPTPQYSIINFTVTHHIQVICWPAPAATYQTAARGLVTGALVHACHWYIQNLHMRYTLDGHAHSSMSENISTMLDICSGTRHQCTIIWTEFYPEVTWTTDGQKYIIT